MSTIEWTDETWNPVTGCTRVGDDCDHCYAARESYRLEQMGQQKYEGLTVLNNRGDRHFNGVVRCHEGELDRPRRWRKPRIVFVNSMGDLFHEDVPLDFVQRVFQVMVDCPRHRFQILTKRPERMLELAPNLPWPSNVWAGTSVGKADYYDRVRALQRLKQAAIRFLSCEPLIGPMDGLPLDGIEWVILGGESGGGARPCDLHWVREAITDCRAAGVPVFVKQLGLRPFENGARLGLKAYHKGNDMNEWPEDLRVREMPELAGASSSIQSDAFFDEDEILGAAIGWLYRSFVSPPQPCRYRSEVDPESRTVELVNVNGRIALLRFTIDRLGRVRFRDAEAA